MPGKQNFVDLRFRQTSDTDAPDLDSNPPVEVTGVDGLPVSHVGPIALATTGFGKLVLTRRANNTTQYTANDVVGVAFDLGVMGVGGQDCLIQSTVLQPRLTAVPGTAAMGNMRLALYNMMPPSAYADNAAWTVPAIDVDAYIDIIDLGTPALPATGAQLITISRDNIGKSVRLPVNGHLYGYLVTDVGYTPAAASELYAITVKSIAL